MKELVRDLGRARETNKICGSTRGNCGKTLRALVSLFSSARVVTGVIGTPVPCIGVTARTVTWQGVSKKKNYPNSFLL